MNWMRNTARSGSNRNRSDPSGASAADSRDFANDFHSDVFDFADFDVTFDEVVFETNGNARVAPDPDGVQVSSPSMIATPIYNGGTPSLTTTDDSTLDGDHSDRVLGRPLESVEDLDRQVRQAVERNSLAWNTGDLRTYLDGYSEDVRYLNASMLHEKGTMLVCSKKSLEMLFRGLFEQSRTNIASAQSVETTIEDVKLMGREHAYVFGTYQHGANGGVFSLTMVKENSQWLIQTKHASVKPARAQQQLQQQPTEGNGRSSTGNLRSSSGSLRSSVTSSSGTGRSSSGSLRASVTSSPGTGRPSSGKLRSSSGSLRSSVTSSPGTPAVNRRFSATDLLTSRKPPG